MFIHGGYIKIKKNMKNVTMIVLLAHVTDEDKKMQLFMLIAR